MKSVYVGKPKEFLPCTQDVSTGKYNTYVSQDEKNEKQCEIDERLVKEKIEKLERGMGTKKTYEKGKEILERYLRYGGTKETFERLTKELDKYRNL